ncbi:hypothetical protein MXD81_63670 [Microbacteriaceae bacterium K1510]|nr:hypothetical protein [Microbacteriaceae bacterium K1510]
MYRFGELSSGMQVGSQYAVAIKQRPDVTPDSDKLDGLLAVFHSVCNSLGLDADDEPLAQIIARTIIEAGLAGEDDPDRLFEHAMQVALTS